MDKAKGEREIKLMNGKKLRFCSALMRRISIGGAADRLQNKAQSQGQMLVKGVSTNWLGME